MTCSQHRRWSAAAAAAAVGFALLPIGSGVAESAPPGSAAAAPAVLSTPRMPDGHPDLSGWWNGRAGGGLSAGDQPTEGTTVTIASRGGDLGNFEKDFAVLERANPNMPIYKPQYWETIQETDYHGLTRDPVFNCLPAGLPRMGAPDKIVQTADEVIFLYSGHEDPYRIIPIDGRPFDPLQVSDITWRGHSVGHFEGNTLVIESTGFNAQSWLGWAGWMHSSDMKVTERVRREGNTLHWQATVEDSMLMEPWTTDPIVKRLNTDPHPFFFESLPCSERDKDKIVDQNVRG